MDPLIINPTNTTPFINFDPEKGTMEISGYSRPENVRIFYEPVLNWLETLKSNLLDKIKSEERIDPINFNFKLIYFNSSSAKFLYDVVIILNEIQHFDIPLSINWYYDKEDSELREAGEDLSELAQGKFNFIAQ